MKPKRLETRIRRDQIVEAAFEIVNSQGIGALNIAAVAHAVGIVPSAVYRHFESKSAIVSALLERIRVRLTANFESVRRMDVDAVEQLRLLLHHHIDVIHQHRAIPRLIFSEEIIGGKPETRRQLYDVIRDVIQAAASVVEDGQNARLIRTDMKPQQLAMVFMGLIQPAVMIWHLSDGQFDLNDHRKQAWRIFSEAIAPRR
jgi:AcrR family transcriptional regulator